jgi:hypothetical protein
VRDVHDAAGYRRSARIDQSHFCPNAPACYLFAVDVILRKVGRGGGRAVTGRLVKPPKRGGVLVIEFADGVHEYVTTPVKRVLRLAGQDVYYVQTANSRYRMEVSSGELDQFAFDDVSRA